MKPHPLEWSRPADAPIEWHGESAYDLDALFGGGNTAPSSRTEAAEEFLIAALSDGPRLSKEVYEAAQGKGIPEMTVRRACKTIETEARRVGVGRAAPWYIGLPGCDWHALGLRVFGAIAHPPDSGTIDDQTLDSHDDRLIDATAPAAPVHEDDQALKGKTIQETVETESIGLQHSLFAGPPVAVQSRLDDQRIDDQPVTPVDERLIVPPAPQPPPNACTDCGAPCGNAIRCSPCATKAVPWRFCRACRAKLRDADTKATGYCATCGPQAELVAEDAEPPTCSSCDAPITDGSAWASGLCAECRALPWNCS